MMVRVKKLPPPEPPEPCVVPGCENPCTARTCACKQHFDDLPQHEQVIWFNALEASFMAADVQYARKLARLRVAAVLRGVRT